MKKRVRLILAAIVIFSILFLLFNDKNSYATGQDTQKLIDVPVICQSGSLYFKSKQIIRLQEAGSPLLRFLFSRSILFPHQ